jgi:hypothetical protein
MFDHKGVLSFLPLLLATLKLLAKTAPGSHTLSFEVLDAFVLQVSCVVWQYLDAVYRFYEEAWQSSSNTIAPHGPRVGRYSTNEFVRTLGPCGAIVLLLDCHASS